MSAVGMSLLAGKVKHRPCYPDVTDGPKVAPTWSDAFTGARHIGEADGTFDDAMTRGQEAANNVLPAPQRLLEGPVASPASESSWAQRRSCFLY
jgi:hypothetical protein